MNRQTLSVVLGLVILAQGTAEYALAQRVADRVQSVSNGTVRFSFATREGVCGQGDNITNVRTVSRYWEPTCESGPARVLVEIRDGRPVRLRTYIGGHWVGSADAIDLGTVAVAEAVDYLLHLAGTETTNVARPAAFSATLADSVEVWPRLLEIAEDPNRPRSVRRGAQERLGMLAAETLDPVDEGDVDPDRKLREQAVFALTQLPRDEGIPRLVDIATNHNLSYVRSRALFWLGQSGDPRALVAIARVLSDSRSR